MTTPKAAIDPDHAETLADILAAVKANSALTEHLLFMRKEFLIHVEKEESAYSKFSASTDALVKSVSDIHNALKLADMQHNIEMTECKDRLRRELNAEFDANIKSLKTELIKKIDEIGGMKQSGNKDIYAKLDALSVDVALNKEFKADIKTLIWQVSTAIGAVIGGIVLMVVKLWGDK